MKINRLDILAVIFFLISLSFTFIAGRLCYLTHWVNDMPLIIFLCAVVAVLSCVIAISSFVNAGGHFK